MKTTTLQNKNGRVHQNFKFTADYSIILQLYCINKAALQKKVPLLPWGDYRRNVIPAQITVSKEENHPKHSITEYLYSWFHTLCKKAMV
jgi:hypothetical protein